jgi:phosphatidylserine decarboxylase
VKIDRAAFPFVALAAIPPALCFWFGASGFAWPLLVLPLAVALFFRDPERASPRDPAQVLAPADGKVMFAGEARTDEAPPGEWRQVTIFLSLLDVHINRSPVGGVVTRVDYHAGSYLPAYRREAFRNERSEIWIDHDGTAVVARQVVGVLARRVVCRVKAGDSVSGGGRIGLMKFGSRMDVFVPATSELRVSAGDTVRAGVSVIAVLRQARS